MKTVRFVTPASVEMAQAAEWYEQQAPGLGETFLDRIDAAAAFIQQYPQASEELHDGLRRKMIRQFPFGLLYAVELDEIVVHAVMHLHRRPGYWDDRQ